MQKNNKMTIQQIEQQTKTLNQQDFLEYLYRLPQIAKEKYSLNIFLQNLGKQTDTLKEQKIDVKKRTHPGIENLLAHTGILEGIDISDISDEELYLQED